MVVVVVSWSWSYQDSICTGGWYAGCRPIGARAGTLFPTSLPAGVPGGSGLRRGQPGTVDGKGWLGWVDCSGRNLLGYGGAGCRTVLPVLFTTSSAWCYLRPACKFSLSNPLGMCQHALVVECLCEKVGWVDLSWHFRKFHRSFSRCLLHPEI